MKAVVAEASNQRRCNMQTNAAARKWRTSLVGSAVLRAAGLSTFGFIGWLWFSWPNDSAWKALSLVPVLALAALVGIVSCLPRARSERRWRAALDLYAER